MDTKTKELTEKIENNLEEKYGEEFEVLSLTQPQLFPTDNGAIYATCIAKSDPTHPFEGVYYDNGIAHRDGGQRDGYVRRLIDRQVEEIVEQVVSQLATNYYIVANVGFDERYLDIPWEEASAWKNYRSFSINNPEETTNVVHIYFDMDSMIGKTDEEEYQMYERLVRDKIGCQFILYIYYLDKEALDEGRKILETCAPGNWGSDLADIENSHPSFGTIMRIGSDTFDDSLEVFKAAKQGVMQERYK